MFKSYFKKIYPFVLTIVFALLMFVPITDASAKTIQDLRNEIEKIKQEKATAEANSQETQNQIDAKKAEISEITIKISNATKEQDDLNSQIKELGEKIDVKQEQIKDLVSFYQLSSNENFYLKYLFGSDSFEDFIYRFSVVSQLTTKSDELVDEMNTLISENEAKVKELDAKKVELNELNRQALDAISTLGNQKSAYIEEAQDYDTQIQGIEEQIQRNLDAGCGETENLSLCNSAIPYDYGFNRPLTHGLVTDEYGMRWHPTKGYYTLHSGIDLAGNSEGTPIYAAASGKVSHIFWRLSCGGNQVVINHTINGRAYTTVYMHMLSVSIEEGDIVSKGDVIGTVGGGRGTSSYETCSTGAHLHLSMATGHYYGTGDESYSTYSSWVNHLIDPRDVLYFPAYGVWW